MKPGRYHTNDLQVSPVGRFLSAALLLVAAAASLGSTNQMRYDPALASRPSSPVPAGPKDWFEDVTAKAGLSFVHFFPHHRIANILLSNGAGGAVLDLDNDGLMDIFLLDWAPLPGVTSPHKNTSRHSNRLFRNLGGGRFEDVTDRSGLGDTGFSHAATAGDFDNDGYTDLCVASVGRKHLFRNRGDGSFVNVTERCGVSDTGTGIAAVFFDADNDGWLDLFVANYLSYKPEAESEQNPGAYPGPLAYPGEANRFFRNRGDGTFVDATHQAGLHVPGHRAMAVTAFDCDWDGDTDLYICNDDTPNMLWINDGRGHFTDVAVSTGVAFNSIGEAPGSMNAAVADVNGDGLMDLFITRLGYGSLYVRDPRGHYEDRMWASGLGRLTQAFVGWGGVFLDFDNDGDPDLATANGSAFVLDGTRTLLMENLGDGRFADASLKAGAVFQHRICGRGNAALDFDNDGRQDLLLTALADRPYLLRNRCPAPHHWLKLRLQGSRSNRNGYGARITLTAGAVERRAEALCPTGFLFQGDARVHFGLGPSTRVDQLRIQWPSGTTQVLRDIAADQILLVREPHS